MTFNPTVKVIWGRMWDMLYDLVLQKQIVLHKKFEELMFINYNICMYDLNNF